MREHIPDCDDGQTSHNAQDHAQRHDPAADFDQGVRKRKQHAVDDGEQRGESQQCGTVLHALNYLLSSSDGECTMSAIALSTGLTQSAAVSATSRIVNRSVRILA